MFEFERKLNHYGSGLTGIDLSNSDAHDEIIMIRVIEQCKEQIANDPELKKPITKRTKVHVYRDYCDTCLNVEKDETGESIDLPNVSDEVFGEAITLALLPSE